MSGHLFPEGYLFIGLFHHSTLGTFNIKKSNCSYQFYSVVLNWDIILWTHSSVFLPPFFAPILSSTPIPDPIRTFSPGVLEFISNYISVYGQSVSCYLIHSYVFSFPVHLYGKFPLQKNRFRNMEKTRKTTPHKHCNFCLLFHTQFQKTSKFVDPTFSSVIHGLMFFYYGFRPHSFIKTLLQRQLMVTLFKMRDTIQLSVHCRTSLEILFFSPCLPRYFFTPYFSFYFVYSVSAFFTVAPITNNERMEPFIGRFVQDIIFCLSTISPFIISLTILVSVTIQKSMISKLFIQPRFLRLMLQIRYSYGYTQCD